MVVLPHPGPLVSRRQLSNAQRALVLPIRCAHGGKVAIEDEVLLKNGVFSFEERGHDAHACSPGAGASQRRSV